MQENILMINGANFIEINISTLSTLLPGINFETFCLLIFFFLLVHIIFFPFEEKKEEEKEKLVIIFSRLVETITKINPKTWGSLGFTKTRPVFLALKRTFFPKEVINKDYFIKHVVKVF